MSDLLFYRKGHLSDLIHRLRQKYAEHIRSLPDSRLTENTLDALIEEFTGNYRVPPLELQEEDITTAQNNQMIPRDDPFIEVSHVPGCVFSFHVPFKGHADLFAFRPSRYSMNPPRGSVSGHTLTLTYAYREADATKVRADFDADMAKIREYIATQTQDLEPYNSNLPGDMRAHLSHRMEKLQKNQDVLSQLGFPAKNQAQQQPAVPVNITKKRRIVLSKPPRTEAAAKVYEQMHMKLYEQVLESITSIGKMMERSPDTYAGLGEEDLRQVLLTGLNDQYGATSGEAFNSHGKTDILIEQEGERLFIAECKVWGGGKVFTAAISQLLDLYLTWRDTKTAVILFSALKNFSTVLEQIPSIVQKHEYFDSAEAHSGRGHFRYLFKHPRGENQKITLSVIAFDLPK